MCSDSQPRPNHSSFSYYDNASRVTLIRDPVVSAEVAKDARAPSEPIPKFEPPYTFEHDKDKRVFRLRWNSGDVETFRDKPAFYLVVEPDPVTGEMRPATGRSWPIYLYLCREEREVR